MQKLGISGAFMGAAAAGTLMLACTAAAQDKSAEPPKPPVSWFDTVKFYGHLEGGMTFKGDGPSNGINFGHLFTDRSHALLLNQLLLTAERPLDPKATGFDFGFKFQFMYGTDARYTHFLGELDRVTSKRGQLDIVEAFGIVHLPWLTEGGIDVKFGQFVTLEGAEVIDAKGNFFYSHSYIFNFGIPFKHTGFMTITHLNPMIDIYAGLTTGVNTTFGRGDNNGALAFHGGIGFNLFEGALTVLATTHIGPENPRGTVGINVNSDLRYLNDVTITWKATDKLTFMADFNYIRDDGFKADGYGGALYALYTINDWLKVGVRGEIWRDNIGFYVAAFPGNLDFNNLLRGRPSGTVGGGKTTYGAITVGLNITPPIPYKTFEGLMIRPEIRYDRSLNGTRPFDAGTSRSQFTFGADLIIPFSIF